MRGTRTNGTVRERRDPPSRRVDKPRGTGFDAHRRVATSDEIGVEARHRRQPPGDRPRRQSRLAIAHAHHRAITALRSEELEHVRRRHLHRVLRHHREERLQIERHRPQRVRPTPTSDELQIAIHQRMHRARNGRHHQQSTTEPDTEKSSSVQAPSTTRPCRGCPKDHPCIRRSVAYDCRRLGAFASPDPTLSSAFVAAGSG